MRRFETTRRCAGLAAVALIAALGTTRAAEPASKATFTLRGVDGPPVQVPLDEFRRFPHVEVEAVGHDGKSAKYKGVTLRTLIDSVNVPRGKQLRGEWLGRLVCVEAADGYRAVFALPECDPEFTDRQIILADERDGEPLDTDKGPFQIIVPGEKRPPRWVRTVKEIRVVDLRALEKATEKK